MRVVIGWGLALVVLLSSAAARAAEPVGLVLKDGAFTPGELRVPAGQRFQIELQNQGDKPAELESPELKIEKVVVPGGKITVSAGPLKPGRYRFVDEYNPQAAGTVVAVQGGSEK